jgi:hypothetical protein
MNFSTYPFFARFSACLKTLGCLRIIVNAYLRARQDFLATMVTPRDPRVSQHRFPTALPISTGAS